MVDKHTVSRPDSTHTSSGEDAEEEDDEQRSEAEIKRELRKNAIGRAILQYDRRRGWG